MKNLILYLIAISFFFGCAKKIEHKEETIFLLKTKSDKYLLLNKSNMYKYYATGKCKKISYFNSIYSIEKHIKENDISSNIQPFNWNPPDLKSNVKVNSKYIYSEPWPKGLKIKESVIKDLTYFTCDEMNKIFNYSCPKKTESFNCFGSNTCACDYDSISLK